MAGHRADAGTPPRAAARPTVPLSAGDGRIVRIRSHDGLVLAVRIFDAVSDRLPLLCLPGLSRNSRDFIALGNFFATHAGEPRKVIALDYRGRGLSESDPDWRHYKPMVEAQDVLSVAAALGVEKAILIGTSRGGIITMLLGVLRPTLIAGAVLNDIGPVLEGRGLARIKTYLSTRKSVGSWDEAIALVRSTSEPQFPGLSEADWRALATAYFADSGAGLTPQYDPNLSRTVVDMDVTERIPVLWPQFMSLVDVPMLAIRGENSDLVSLRTLSEMSERHGRMQQHTVPGQGHAPLLRDQATLERIRAFAEGCDV